MPSLLQIAAGAMQAVHSLTKGLPMGFFNRISEGLSRTRERFVESMNLLLDLGPVVDDDFWEELEATLIMADIGAPAAASIVASLHEQATRKGLENSAQVLDMLNDQIAATFADGGSEILEGEGAVVLFVGINGTGKTTTVGKIAKEKTDQGRKVILGSADTFRAAAIEQLEVWANRANVEMVTRDRGAGIRPASALRRWSGRRQKGPIWCSSTLPGASILPIDLMRELKKVVSVVRKRSQMPVYLVLVIDATTGQNGLQQAREFDKALDLDALIVTKLDGTAKGGIALAVSHELSLPILKIGVGEAIDDLRDFDPSEFAAALVGDFAKAPEGDAQ